MFGYKDTFLDHFQVLMNSTIKNYREDPDLQAVIDLVQTSVSVNHQYRNIVKLLIENIMRKNSFVCVLPAPQLQCCGALSSDDWEQNIYFNCSSVVNLYGTFYTPTESCGVPFSCCKETESESTKFTIVNSQCAYGVRDPLFSVELFFLIFVIFLT